MRLSGTLRQNVDCRVVRESRLRRAQYSFSVSYHSGPFLVVLEATERPLDIGGLFAFVAAPEKQHAGLAQHCVVHAVARSPINAKFAQAFAKWLAVGKVS